MDQVAVAGAVVDAAFVGQAVQVFGSLLVLAGFAAAQRGRLSPRSGVYLTLNFVGSATLAVQAALGAQWGFLLLEAVWALVSLVGLTSVTAHALRTRHTRCSTGAAHKERVPSNPTERLASSSKERLASSPKERLASSPTEGSASAAERVASSSQERLASAAERSAAEGSGRDD